MFSVIKTLQFWLIIISLFYKSMMMICSSFVSLIGPTTTIKTTTASTRRDILKRTEPRNIPLIPLINHPHS